MKLFETCFAVLVVWVVALTTTVFLPTIYRDWGELNAAYEYRRQAVMNGIERDNLQLQLDQLRKNIGERKVSGKCVILQPGQRP